LKIRAAGQLLKDVESRKGEDMWKGSYGKEPFDLRLTVLRMIYRLPAIAMITVLGTVIFGGGYYVKNVLLRQQHFYAATSVYRLEYDVDNVEDMMNVFINEPSWNTYIQSRMFLDAVQSYLAEEGTGVDTEELAGALQAFVLTDVRIPSITVTTDSPEKSEAVARAVDEAMTRDISFSEILSVRVIDPGEAVEVLPELRVGRAFVFGGVLSCFFAVVILLLKETGDDSIWLPATLGRRYGLKYAGTVESREFAENMRYFFRERPAGDRAPGDPEGTGGTYPSEADAAGARGGVQENPAGEGRGCEEGTERVAVCMVQEKLQPEKVLEALRKAWPEAAENGWTALPSPLREPKVGRELRKADRILLVVGAGSHEGKKLEYVLEYLEQQDCRVTAAVLWDADEKLIRRYYFGRRGRARA